jgi:CheY-like chemotaxis protein
MLKISKILWVDDDATSILAPLGRLLRKRGQLEMDIESDYETAIHLLSKNQYSAVLVDILLPHSNANSTVQSAGGILLAQHIRDREDLQYPLGKRIPIVILSVVPSAEVDDQLKDLGVHYFDKVTLLDSLDRLISLLSGEDAPSLS